MPARGAGTSFKYFGDKCFGGESYPWDIVKNGEDEIKNILTKEYEIPKLITSHSGSGDDLAHILHLIPKSTLVVYAHRQETSRALSAIKHVVVTCYCNDKSAESSLVEKREDSACYVSEVELVDLVKNQDFEIGEGGASALSCSVYEEIESSSPNMIFMDYSNADEIQSLIAEKYCPDLVGKPVRAPEEEPSPVYVHMNHTVNESGEELVPLDDWLSAKSALLEFALRMNEKATCVAATRKMEDGLFSCEDGYLNSKGLFLN
mmetsp:Transcript_19328/g.33163  ORF Transcript_19328/g.33163 Transcript_19328/m.33163 type:complete len:262 (+) Transcript_19328:293-1078(+)|eukprot:CAMPEP_0183733438 /NCGR_PEP_ID=MMETSP0737-20130205/41199_1 /TAXON_ID=385413 /ORGANISM="Thalassiosira miniscula, Strain CCMP1093" /LENGTH=261 /DNA_ID=CAMNT_0025966691 /DNA_START=255 /DNA_END=1040 /DNA_ORIENTATION=-